MTVQDILARRSIRRYTAEPVTDAQLRAALEAAMAAPSARRCDPWHFIVLTGKDDLNALADILPYGQMLREAGAGIILCGSPEEAHANSLSYLLQDAAAAMENLLLAVHAQGLGAVWLGVHPNEDRMAGIAARFNVPDSILPLGAVAIGHPAEQPEPRTRYNEAKVHYGTW